MASWLLRRYGERPILKLALSALSAATLGFIFAAVVSLARAGDISPHWPQAGIDAGLAVVALPFLLRGTNPLWVLAATTAAHILIQGLRGS
jgi:chromate transport protein ChrA